MIHSQGSSNFFYIAIQFTHNFKTKCVFLFCIKHYTDKVTIWRGFCLFHNSEYVVKEDEQVLVKWLKELTFLQQKCMCTSVLSSMILIRNAPLIPSQAVVWLNINHNRLQLITSDYTHRCLCHVRWGLRQSFSIYSNWTSRVNKRRVATASLFPLWCHVLTNVVLFTCILFVGKVRVLSILSVPVVWMIALILFYMTSVGITE